MAVRKLILHKFNVPDPNVWNPDTMIDFTISDVAIQHNRSSLSHVRFQHWYP